MKERSLGETYDKSYIAIPILESPLFDWIQSINGRKKFYHISILPLGTIDEEELVGVKEAISSIPKNEKHIPIIPERLVFIGENKNAFVLSIKNTEELSKIREMLEEKLPENELNGRSFLPHITIQTAKRESFSKFDRDKLLDIPDRSRALGQYTADKIGLYYRTEEGATALLYLNRI